MRERAGIGCAILTLLFSQCLLPFFTTPEALCTRWLDEVISVRAGFGPALGERVVQGGLSVARGVLAWVPGPETAAAARRERLHENKATAFAATLSGGVLHQTRTYVRSLRFQLQICILRILVVVVWAVCLLPILLAGVIDGLVQREVKLAGRGFQNPTAFALARGALILVGLLPVLYAGFPSAVPMLLVPIALVMVSPPLCLALRHLQPVFTR